MKKVISIVLSFLLIFAMQIMPAFAENEETGTDLDFAKSMGFIADDDEITGDSPMTRIELAEVFYNIVFPTQNISSSFWGETDFPDVPTEKKHIASAVYGMGVMRGYSDTVFAPDDTVTMNQVVKAMVSFLGYDLQANRLGGYPSGYLSQATFMRILPSSSFAGDTEATFGDVATLLKKAIGVDVATFEITSSDGTGTQRILKDVDYLEHYRGIHITKGVISGNYLTDINGGSSTNFFSVKINGYNMEVAETAHGLQDMLGYNVYVYYTDDGNYKEAVYFEAADNSVLEISSNELISVSKGSVKYYLPGESAPYTASFDSRASLIFNGTNETVYTADDLNPFKLGNYDGSIKLIDTENDGIYDYIVITAFQTYVVNDVRNNKIYGMYEVSSNPYDKVIDLTYYKERNINIRSIIGEPMEVSDIRSGNVINVCYDKAGVVKEIIVSKDTMSGVLEEISYSGSKMSSIKIGGLSFDVASNVIVMDSANKLAPGVYANVFLNCQLEIAVVDLENSYTEGFSVGYLVDAGTEGGLEKSVLCMIFDTEGNMNTYNLYSRIALNGTPMDDVTAFEQFGKEGYRVKRQLVLYKTDAEGKYITSMEVPQHLEDTSQAYDGIYQFPGDEFSFVSGHRTFNNIYAGADDAVVFNVPEEDNRDAYDKYSIGILPTGEDNNLGPALMQLYGTKKEAFVVNYAVVGGLGSTGDTSKRPVFLVTDVISTLDENGDAALKIKGVSVEAGGITNTEFFIKEELFTKGHDLGSTSDSNYGKRPFIDQSETLPSPGDVFRVPAFSGTGKITEMDITQFIQLYDYEDGKFVTSSGFHGQNLNAHVYGTVLSKEGSAVKLLLPDNSIRTLYLGSYSLVEVKQRKKDGKISTEKVGIEAVLAEDTHPGEASRLLYHYRGRGIGGFIFND